jgi:hypothetical protein
MENKLKWNESGRQKAAGKRFAYPFTGPLDGKRYLPRRVSSSTTVRPLKRTNAAFFIHWKGNGSRLSIVIVPSDSRLLKIQDPGEVSHSPAGWTSAWERIVYEEIHLRKRHCQAKRESRA